jgi:hypothetical protein
LQKAFSRRTTAGKRGVEGKRGRGRSTHSNILRLPAPAFPARTIHASRSETKRKQVPWKAFFADLREATLSWVVPNVQADCRIPAPSLKTRNLQRKLVSQPWMALMDIGPAAPPASKSPKPRKRIGPRIFIDCLMDAGLKLGCPHLPSQSEPAAKTPARGNTKC